MSKREEAHQDLKRLKRALDALADDLDAIEQRGVSQNKAETPNDNGSHGIESFVDRFAFAVKQGITSLDNK
jgi:hypothetical protein